MMKALVVDRNSQLSMMELTRPRFQENQALVRMLACGVCNGTDGKLIHHHFKGIGAEQYPLMLGHEGVGEVIETGSAVRGLKIGDRVLLPFNGAIDGIQSAWGAFAEYAVVTDAEAIRQQPGASPDLIGLAEAQTVLPDSIDPVDAVMIITFREVLSSIQKFGIGPDDTVVVFGCGPVGLTFIRLLSLSGVYKIVAVANRDDRIPAAQAMGARLAINGSTEDVAQVVRTHFPDGASHVIDAVGSSGIINQAMPLLKDHGKICCYGISSNTAAQIDWSLAPYNWALVFQQFPAKAEEASVHGQVLDWMKIGKLDARAFISDVIPFERCLDAFQLLEEKKINKKCVITFSNAG